MRNNILHTLFSTLRADERGATAIEYGLMAALIGVAIISGAKTLGKTANATFDCAGLFVSHPDKFGSAGNPQEHFQDCQKSKSR